MIKIFLILIIISVTTACTNVKDGLTLKKKTGADEFLVKKKNPLVLPPEFNNLPTPDEINTNDETETINDIEELLRKNKNKTSQIESSSGEIETSILKKIKTK